MIFNLITKAKELLYKNGKNVEEALDEVNSNLFKNAKDYTGLNFDEADFGVFVSSATPDSVGATNSPVNKTGMLIHYKTDMTSYQEYHTYDGEIYVRSRYRTNAWTAWDSYALNSNFEYKSIVDSITIPSTSKLILADAHIESGSVYIRFRLPASSAGGTYQANITDNKYCPRNNVCMNYAYGSSNDIGSVITATINNNGTVTVWTSKTNANDINLVVVYPLKRS